MSHTYSNLLSHVVFSTKDRRPLIDPDLKPRLLGYINGIVDESGGRVLSLNAMPDHLHMLWELPPAKSLSASMRVLKNKLFAMGTRDLGIQETLRLADRLCGV
jgi:putative transposase